MKFVELTRKNTAIGIQKISINRDMIERITPTMGSDEFAGSTVIRMTGKNEIVVLEDYETVKGWLNG